MRIASCVVLAVWLAAGCAYPRRETLSYPAPNVEGPVPDEPSHVWSIRLIDAELPPFKGSGLPWDTDGTGPDPFLRLILDDRVVWESPPQENTLHPVWNVTLPRNIYVGNATRFRIEMRDKDAGGSDPAGAIVRIGLPETALPNAKARLPLDNLGTVAITVASPRPSRGVGLSYEVRGDGLRLLAVDPYSPAARAGLRAGETIVAIAGSRVDDIGGDKAASQLALAADRGSSLVVADQRGKEREAHLDRSFLWLIM